MSPLIAHFIYLFLHFPYIIFSLRDHPKVMLRTVRLQYNLLNAASSPQQADSSHTCAGELRKVHSAVGTF